MKSLRQVIRKLILESQGMNIGDVWDVADADLMKRHAGHYAKDVFRQRADRNWLNSLGYIHTKPFDGLDSWLSSANSKDELSCLINSSAYTGQKELYIDSYLGKFFEGERIGLIVEGWVTWASNRNINSGFTGTLKDRYGEKPHSGINKAPGKIFSKAAGKMGRMLPQHELDHALMDDEDVENMGMIWQDETGKTAKNNEALVDNWKVVGVCQFIRDQSEYYDELVSEEYNKKVQEAFAKIKRKFPKAKLIQCVID